MADIEMPLAAGGSAAPDPSRCVFGAWKDRFLICFFAADDPNDEPFEGVKAADGDQCSRLIFLSVCSLIDFLLYLGSALLVNYVQPSTVGHAAFVASRVLGYAGMAATFCLAILLVHLWHAVASGNRIDQRMIDDLM